MEFTGFNLYLQYKLQTSGQQLQSRCLQHRFYISILGKKFGRSKIKLLLQKIIIANINAKKCASKKYIKAEYQF
jgi:hypothetical protein